MSEPRIDRQEILRTMSTLFQPGAVVELRVLDARTATFRNPHVESGYFDDWSHLADAVGDIAAAKGVYVTLNMVNPALPARAANRIGPAGRDPLTGDRDVIRRRWLPLDFDPVRPAGISASDEEHTHALACARMVKQELVANGWPAPVVADSGNGAHILFAVDLPADDAGLVERCLAALAGRFDARMSGVVIDPANHNPARIWKLYGTRACKGDSTAERPRRMARLLEVPERVMPVPQEVLEALAQTRPPVTTPRAPRRAYSRCFLKSNSKGRRRSS